MESTNTSHKPLTKGDDHLSNLIPELLVEVLSHVSSKDYLSLVHTNQSLRDFLQENAANVCNKAVQNLLTIYFVNPISFPTEFVQGWLVPTAPVFVETEKEYTADVPDYFAEYEIPASPFDLKIKLSQPGPQFLLFLEVLGDELLPLYGMEAAQYECEDKPTDCAVLKKFHAVMRRQREVLVLVNLHDFLVSVNGNSKDEKAYRCLTMPPKVGGDLIWHYRCQ
ncbi:hypothetical protein VTL71DRAFT_10156 [Oculimacula yallundae]|uniref:F-box domain-containing protein n=1 Tax=Oculimacula yallundae TaxID=86028 RepID=A0ABR4BPQ7_9HELO